MKVSWKIAIGFFLVTLFFQGCFSKSKWCWITWWREKCKTDSEIAPETPSTSYNCSFNGNGTADPVKASVRNVNNISDVLCQAILMFSETMSEEDQVHVCNHLGKSVCPNCTEDPSYTELLTPDVKAVEDVSNPDAVQNASISCAKEDTATTFPSTGLLSTSKAATRSYEAGPVSSYDTDTTSSHETGTKVPAYRGGQKDQYRPVNMTMILLIVFGVLILLISVVLGFVISKRTKKKDQNEEETCGHRGNENEVVRVEGDATGELYTAVGRAKSSSDQMVENMLYGSTKAEQVTDNQEVGTVVENLLYDSAQVEQVLDKREAYTEVVLKS